MSRILHLRKRLISLPAGLAVPGVAIRPFNGGEAVAGSSDAQAWLGLREGAFAGLTAAGRPWSTDDFHREFTAKPWWDSSRMLFAVEDDGAAGTVLGSIALGRAGRPPNDYASLMWLMVAPEARRRGIGRLLLAAIERQAYEAGETTLALETHAAWSEAVRLYRAAGYEEAMT